MAKRKALAGSAVKGLMPSYVQVARVCCCAQQTRQRAAAVRRRRYLHQVLVDLVEQQRCVACFSATTDHQARHRQPSTSRPGLGVRSS